MRPMSDFNMILINIRKSQDWNHLFFLGAPGAPTQVSPKNPARHRQPKSPGEQQGGTLDVEKFSEMFIFLLK